MLYIDEQGVALIEVDFHINPYRTIDRNNSRQNSAEFYARQGSFRCPNRMYQEAETLLQIELYYVVSL